jgi:hypothetical protein
MRGIHQRISQNTARIDRIMINAPICRTFLRAVLLWVLDRQGMVTDRHDKYRPRIDCLEMSRFAGLSPPRQVLRSVRSVFPRTLCTLARLSCLWYPDGGGVVTVGYRLSLEVLHAHPSAHEGV